MSGWWIEKNLKKHTIKAVDLNDENNKGLWDWK